MPHSKKIWRDQLEDLAGNDPLIWIYLNCSLETCFSRNASRITERVVSIIYNEFQPPSNPDICINTDSMEADRAMELMLESIEKFSK